MNGPASDTQMLSLRGWRRRDTLTGTGLAQPKASPVPESMRSPGRINGSQGVDVGKGFSVSRPARLAVSSPKIRATAPWETSWRMIDGMRTQTVDDRRTR